MNARERLEAAQKALEIAKDEMQRCQREVLRAEAACILADEVEAQRKGLGINAKAAAVRMWMESRNRGE